MTRLQITPNYRGPTVLELQRSGLLDAAPHTVEAAWSNSRAEITAVQRHPHISFVLMVPDMQAAGRAAAALRLNLTVPEETIATGIQSLRNMEVSDWRAFTVNVGTPVARTLLVRFAGDVVRNGGNPTNLRRVVDQCLLHGVSPADASVLLGLSGLCK